MTDLHDVGHRGMIDRTGGAWGSHLTVPAPRGGGGGGGIATPVGSEMVGWQGSKAPCPPTPPGVPRPHQTDGTPEAA